MAITHNQWYGIIQPHGEVFERVIVSFFKAACATYYEATNVENHAERIQLAKSILTNEQDLATKYYKLILSNGELQTAMEADEITDAVVENAVNGFYTNIAVWEA